MSLIQRMWSLQRQRTIVVPIRPVVLKVLHGRSPIQKVFIIIQFQSVHDQCIQLDPDIVPHRWTVKVLMIRVIVKSIILTPVTLSG